MAENKVPDVVRKAIEQAVRLLDASGSSYKIIAPDGVQHGKLELAPEKKRKINKTRPYGAVSAYYTKYVNFDAKPGDVFVIPVPKEFTAEEIRGGVSTKLSGRWGNGTYTTALTKDSVEFLRLS